MKVYSNDILYINEMKYSTETIYSIVTCHGESVTITVDYVQ